MNEFKCVLTRVCIRSGQIHLPGRMLQLFPSEGTIQIQDAERNERFTLEIADGKRISGLDSFFKAHKLSANDELHIEPLEDGSFRFKAVKHPKRLDPHDPQAIRGFLDRLAEQATALSEAEIRDLYPDLPQNLKLADVLHKDERFVRKHGRWQLQELTAAEATDTDISNKANNKLNNKTSNTEAGTSSSVTPYPRNVIFPKESGLNSATGPSDLSHQHRIKNLLAQLGFRAESLSYGQVIAHAELGRKHYSVLIQLLEDHSQIDWPALLSRRREKGNKYLAVFGDHRDLIRHINQAAASKASLWSWTGLERLEALLSSVPLSPVELEPHFDKHGLFEEGLKLFETSISQRISERGHFSAILTRLATLRAPTVFMLDDIADKDLPKDIALRMLDRLSQAPFELVAKVDSGEFCLRFKVADGLTHFSDYALSLRDHLPSRRTERLTATEDLSETQAEAVSIKS